jgi:hypothetical protein
MAICTDFVGVNGMPYKLIGKNTESSYLKKGIPQGLMQEIYQTPCLIAD